MVTIEWNGGKVRFLDQTLLPHEERYVVTDDYREIARGIRELKIRGAPALGVAAALGATLAVHERNLNSVDDARSALMAATALLAATRPTAVNLSASLDRVTRRADLEATATLTEFRERILNEALTILREDREACAAIARNGAPLVAAGSSILTHCNTGALATAGEGTALAVIAEAHRQGRVRKVYVDETRPLLQGARLTMWELMSLGIDAVLITDSAAATVLQRGMVDMVIVGADRIAANGDAANKIGTYPLAVLSSRHGIPFYVAAPATTLDLRIASGGEIPIEERAPEEVTHIAGNRIAPEGTKVFSPAFDVTPNELISAFVTDVGVLRPPYGPALAAVAGERADRR